MKKPAKWFVSAPIGHPWPPLIHRETLALQHETPEKRYLQDLARWKLPFHVCVCFGLHISRNECFGTFMSRPQVWMVWMVWMLKPWFLQACLQNQSSEYEISGVYPSRFSLLWVSCRSLRWAARSAALGFERHWAAGFPSCRWWKQWKT